jgi:hypothetical protein
MCDPKSLVGVPTLNPNDTVKDWGWIDNPHELNLTDHSRFIIEHAPQASTEWAA